MTKESFESVWDNLLVNFDWEKVYQTVKALKWKYWDTSKELPCASIGEIVKTAHYVCQRAYDSGKIIGTGGFCAYPKEDGNIRLVFEVTSWESYD